MTFFIIWALVLGTVVAIGALIWAVRTTVLWLRAKHPTAGERLGWALVVLATTAYVSLFIWGAVS